MRKVYNKYTINNRELFRATCSPGDMFTFRKLDSQVPCKGTFPHNFDEIGRDFTGTFSLLAYTGVRIRRINCTAVHERVYTRPCARRGWSALFWMNWSTLSEDETRSLYLPRADECVSLVVTCLGNITEIQLLPRYTDVARVIPHTHSRRWKGVSSSPPPLSTSLLFLPSPRDNVAHNCTFMLRTRSRCNLRNQNCIIAVFGYVRSKWNKRLLCDKITFNKREDHTVITPR